MNNNILNEHHYFCMTKRFIPIGFFYSCYRLSERVSDRTKGPNNHFLIAPTRVCLRPLYQRSSHSEVKQFCRRWLLRDTLNKFLFVKDFDSGTFLVTRSPSTMENWEVNCKMGNGESRELVNTSRPAVYTESRCHNDKELVETLLCDICKDILWEWWITIVKIFIFRKWDSC